MKRAALIALCLLGGCSKPRTEAVVIISTDGIRIPDDVAALHLTVFDKAPGGDDPVFDQQLPICREGHPGSCYPLPLSMTLIRGAMRPGDSVRVLVDAINTDGKPVISDAALFTFSPEHSLRLDFVLYANCLGNVDCSHLDMACGPEDRCYGINPMTFTGEPDLSASPADLSAPGDFGNEDLSPSLVDLASSDLSHLDLTGCVPQCTGRTCGDDTCFGMCGMCSGFNYCQAATGTCQPCGALNEFCCAQATCKFGLVCDGTNHCVNVMVGMEPPCGAATQQCCPGSQCDPGLVCDTSVHCFPPPPDLMPPPQDFAMPPQDFSMPPQDLKPPPMDFLLPPNDLLGPTDGPCGLYTQTCCNGVTCSQGFCDVATTTCQPTDLMTAGDGGMVSPSDGGAMGPCGNLGDPCCPVPPFIMECMSGLTCDTGATNTCIP
jgi:hypothetical protein